MTIFSIFSFFSSLTSLHFSTPNQISQDKTKISFIPSFFYHLPISYPPTFSCLQPNGPLKTLTHKRKILTQMILVSLCRELSALPHPHELLLDLLFRKSKVWIQG